jgi:hypothetical protein
MANGRISKLCEGNIGVRRLKERSGYLKDKKSR